MKIEVKQYIKTWKDRCYDEIPDEVPKRINQLHKAPSYKRICMAILKNDISILGFTLKKSKWYGILKKIEIDNRNNNV